MLAKLFESPVALVQDCENDKRTCPDQEVQGRQGSTDRNTDPKFREWR